MTDRDRPKVLLACGYFDWFSGYQEVGLARALAPLVDTHVLAGDVVNPLFTDDHLQQVGQPRHYAAGTTREHNVTITRLKCHERRSMVWSSQAKGAVASGDYDLVIQVMPGQGLPAAASLAGKAVRRSVLYGDNVAMYAALGGLPARLKYLAFGATKGTLYRFVNSRAANVYGYTPNTLSRLAPFTGRRTMHLLPLAFDSSTFSHDEALRIQWRAEHGYDDDDVVVLAAGKIQTQKRIDALVRAIGLLAPRHDKVHLHVIGADDSPASRAVRSAASAQPGTNVTIEGFLDARSLNVAFNGADVGVWPVMPAITIQQAMGTGLPVLLPDNDLVAHLIDRPESGTTYRVREPLEESLASALDTLLDRLTSTAANRGSQRRTNAEANTRLSTPAIARRLLDDADLSPEAT